MEAPRSRTANRPCYRLPPRPELLFRGILVGSAELMKRVRADREDSVEEKQPIDWVV
jgi:hypothetical protein